MKPSRFVNFGLALAVTGFLIIVCVGGALGLWYLAGLIGLPGVDAPRPLRDRIAVLGNDGDVWIVAPDGGRAWPVTRDDRRYLFPTWSPDGRRVAFVGPDEQGNAVLYTYDHERGETAVLFSDPNAAPFYLYWSPDSRSVTFLAQEPSTLTMWLVEVDEPEAGRLLGRGSPLYWVWSPEGDQLLMHVGGSRSASEEAHISSLKNRRGASRVEFEVAPGRFQAPLWSKSGQYVYYVAADEDGQEGIYRTDMESSHQSLLTLVEGPAFLTLAPDDRHIAYLQLQDGAAPALGTAYVMDAQGQNKRPVLEGWVAAMYWSPDGTKLALLTPTREEEDPTARVPGRAAPAGQFRRFRWWIYHVAREELDLLVSFLPTPEFLQTVPFFDQYHLSLTFWSPDSHYLVFTRQESDGQGGSVWVLDTRGEERPHKIGEGNLATWSWR